MYHDKDKQAIHRDSSRIAAAGPAAFGLGVAGAGAGLGGGHQRTTVFSWCPLLNLEFLMNFCISSLK